MSTIEQLKTVSIADYLAGEEAGDVKHEYLGGMVHAMAGGSNRHNTIATNAVIAFGSALRGKFCRAFNSDTKVRIEYPDHTRFYYPDAMVVCAPNPPDDHFQDHPVVVVEVISESTRRTDLGEKRDAYLTIPSLKVLMFVEPDSIRVTLHRRKPEGGFAIEVFAGADAVVPLPEIDTHLPLSELFEDAAG
jgi:Uma2 family endonuclease